jgi:hypothetical protein
MISVQASFENESEVQQCFSLHQVWSIYRSKLFTLKFQAALYVSVILIQFAGGLVKSPGLMFHTLGPHAGAEVASRLNKEFS